MQISLKWMQELVNLDDTHLEDLIEKLTLGGFEIEEILEMEIDHQKQMALEISATANRSDSLSIQGISNEMVALLSKSLDISNYARPSESWKQKISTPAKLRSKDPNCSIFCSIILKNVRDPRVPKWIKEKLRASGIIPSNHFLDFQNYILLETGYPFAFYDFDKIQSKIKKESFSLSILEAKNQQDFLAGNGNQYKLDDSILLIQANEIPISIAGMIENKEFSSSNQTTSLLIEGSLFQAAKIRQQSRNLGLRTDRSTRYEKSLKPTYLLESFYRLISLLRIANPNLKCELHTLTKRAEEKPKPILLRYQTIGEILGPIQEVSSGKVESISPKRIETYLRRLQFDFIYDEIKEVWTIKVPDSRSEDITREIDLIEEIGRLHGFNHFLIHLPKLQTIGTEDRSYKIRKKMTSCLLNLGFNEWIHYSLINPKKLRQNPIPLVNPLVSEYSSLRISLLPNMIQTIQENFKQGNLVMNGFEYGHIFLPDSKNQFQEKEHVAGVFGGFQTKLNWSDSGKAFTWFEAKGRMEQLFEQFNLLIQWERGTMNQTNELFHPYRRADLSLKNGTKVGIFGQLHPSFGFSFPLYLFELNLEVIETQIQINPLPIYKDYSFYPKIIKDISFIIKQEITFEELERTFYRNGSPFLSEIHLLDEYRGQSIPENHTSLCFQCIFQSKEKTLQNKEIEEIVHHLRSVLKTKFDARIRD